MPKPETMGKPHCITYWGGGGRREEAQDQRHKPANESTQAGEGKGNEKGKQPLIIFAE